MGEIQDSSQSTLREKALLAKPARCSLALAGIPTAVFVVAVILIRYGFVDLVETPMVGAALQYTRGIAHLLVRAVGLQWLLFANHRSHLEGWFDFGVLLLAVFIQWWAFSWVLIKAAQRIFHRH